MTNVRDIITTGGRDLFDADNGRQGRQDGKCVEDDRKVGGEHSGREFGVALSEVMERASL